MGTANRTELSKPRGRPFTKGNGGRKPGSKNRSSVLTEAMRDVDATELIQKAFELAKGGNVPMLKFLLERLVPRERLIQLELPIVKYADDVVAALGSIAREATEGRISPSEGAALATLFNSSARAINLEDVVRRLDSIENQLRGRVTA